MDRNTSKYELYQGRQLQYRGITDRPLEEGVAEHRRDGKDFDRVNKVGYKSAREGARTWEREQNERRLPPQNTYRSPLI